jgi:hypothetical protein
MHQDMNPADHFRTAQANPSFFASTMQSLQIGYSLLPIQTVKPQSLSCSQ